MFAKPTFQNRSCLEQNRPAEPDPEDWRWNLPLRTSDADLCWAGDQLKSVLLRLLQTARCDRSCKPSCGLTARPAAADPASVLRTGPDRNRVGTPRNTVQPFIKGKWFSCVFMTENQPTEPEPRVAMATITFTWASTSLTCNLEMFWSFLPKNKESV